jgi:pimeloyl-ACP methyl ester carboxylesterase
MSRHTILLAGTAAAAGLALANWQGARAAEAARPAPGRFMEVDGVRLHYLDRGSGGMAAVMLHGNGSMAEELVSSGVVEMLAERRRVVVIDRPGFGRSDRPHGRRWTPEEQAAIVVSAMRQLDIHRPVVFGHSFGTLVALAVAEDHPEAVGGLVLAAGYHFPTPRLDALAFSPSGMPVVGDVLRYTVSPHLMRAAAWHFIRKLFAPLPIPPRFVREFPLPMAFRPWQLRAMGEETAGLLPAARRISSRLGEVRSPVSILAGDGDRLVTTEAHSQRLHAALPGSRLVVLPGAGHMVHHASPVTVAEEVERLATRAENSKGAVPRQPFQRRATAG